VLEEKLEVQMANLQKSLKSYYSQELDVSRLALEKDKKSDIFLYGSVWQTTKSRFTMKVKDRSGYKAREEMFVSVVFPSLLSVLLFIYNIILFRCDTV